jgi:hypothetical protein
MPGGVVHQDLSTLRVRRETKVALQVARGGGWPAPVIDPQTGQVKPSEQRVARQVLGRRLIETGLWDRVRQRLTEAAEQGRAPHLQKQLDPAEQSPEKLLHVTEAKTKKAA